MLFRLKLQKTPGGSQKNFFFPPPGKKKPNTNGKIKQGNNAQQKRNGQGSENEGYRILKNSVRMGSRGILKLHHKGVQLNCSRWHPFERGEGEGAAKNLQGPVALRAGKKPQWA